MKAFIFVWIWVLSLDASAQEQAFLAPMGAYEGIAGNTGIGRNASVGSVIYNPAGMAGIRSSKISASGSAFSQNYITNKSDDDSEEIKYFQTVPTQITTVFTNPGFNWAFSILSPRAIKFDSKQLNSAGVSYTSTTEDNETLFGPTAAIKFSKHFRMGISVFAAKRDYRETYSLYFEDGTGALVQSSKLDINAMNAYPVLGILIIPNGDLSIGIKYSAPSIRVSGNYEQTFITAGDNTSQGIPNGQNVGKSNSTYHKPADVGVGFSLSTGHNTKIYLDITNQFAKKYDIVQDDLFGEKLSFEFKNVQRYNFAVEYLTSRTDAITFGFMYNPDATKDGNLNFTGITAGYRSLDKLADSSIGFFYNQASEKNDGFETEQRMVGLFLSTSINFIN